ncbi:MAG: glycoside hydrolase family 16 protein, partial [Acidimicrobiia bacterium]|nr:glycoside hydrolase family 16 protein [Acidimicrobiia bacterium]
TVAMTSTAPSTTLSETATPEVTLPEVQSPPGYELVWRDEFTGTELDRSKWNIEHSTFGDGGNTLHCYVPEAVTVDDGLLVLTGERLQMTCPNGSTRQYTSGMVNSQGLATWQYGWFEVRARVPEGKGLWPAIWMSPNSNVYGRWPGSGEIDLMEVRGDRPRTARVNVHYLDTGNRPSQRPHDVNASPGTGFTDAFHTFGLRWEPNLMVFIVDGLEVHTVTNWSSAVGSADAPFDQEFFFRLNLAIGGNYPGSPDEGTPWPARFEIDWVRVFQPRG